jgi:hypothetical protein
MPEYKDPMTTHTHTNIRKEPTRFSDVVQELLENDRVEAGDLVDGDSHEGGNKWFPVKYDSNGVEGYIADYLLTPV